MKRIINTFLVSIIMITVSSCNSQTETTKKNIINPNDFAVEFYECLKNNDFDRLKNNLPKAPFDFYNIRKKKSFTFTQEIYNELLLNLENNFNSLSKIVTNNDLQLYKIETESDKPFQATEIFLTLRNNSGINYKVRIEDCLIHNGKYLPEQLKFRKQ